MIVCCPNSPSQRSVWTIDDQQELDDIMAEIELLVGASKRKEVLILHSTPGDRLLILLTYLYQIAIMVHGNG